MPIQRKPNDAIIEYIDSMTSSMVTKLVATGPIPAETTLSVSASGALYTKSGDTVVLDSSEARFNANNGVRIRLNGVQLIRDVEAHWDSTTTLHITSAMDIEDVLEIEVPIKY